LDWIRGIGERRGDVINRGVIRVVFKSVRGEGEIIIGKCIVLTLLMLIGRESWGCMGSGVKCGKLDNNRGNGEMGGVEREI
jgi:hypothetical protein